MDADRERRRKRIVEITTLLVAGMVEKGELDPSDEKALKQAVRQAARDATAAYNAAEEYLSG